jgi:hypothetical protein
MFEDVFFNVDASYQHLSRRDPLQGKSPEDTWKRNVYGVVKEMRTQNLITRHQWDSCISAMDLIIKRRMQSYRISLFDRFDFLPPHIQHSLAELYDAMNYWVLGWQLGRVHVMQVRQLLLVWSEEIRRIFSYADQQDWLDTAKTLRIPNPEMDFLW